jgi:hypothetical protein
VHPEAEKEREKEKEKEKDKEKVTSPRKKVCHSISFSYPKL